MGKGVEFLLIQYDTIATLHQDAKEVGDKRLNFLLTFIGVVITVLIAAPQFVDFVRFTWIFFTGITFSLLLGLITFRKMLQRRETTIVYRRRLARIARWFSENDPSIIPGLPYTINENDIPMDWPKRRWGRWGTTAFSVLLINCILVILFILYISVALIQVQPYYLSIPVAAVGAIVTWWLLNIYKRAWMRAAEQRDYRA